MIKKILIIGVPLVILTASQPALANDTAINDKKHTSNINSTYSLTSSSWKKIILKSVLKRKLKKIKEKAKKFTDQYFSEKLKNKKFTSLIKKYTTKNNNFNVTYGVGLRIDPEELISLSIPNLDDILVWFPGHSKELKVLSNKKIENSLMGGDYHPLITRVYNTVPSFYRDKGTTGGCAECAILMRFLHYFSGSKVFNKKNIADSKISKFPSKKNGFYEKKSNFSPYMKKAVENLKYTFFLTNAFKQTPKGKQTFKEKPSCDACNHVHRTMFRTYDFLRSDTSEIVSQIFYREVQSRLNPNQSDRIQIILDLLGLD